MRKLSLIAAGVSMVLAGTANASLDSSVQVSIFFSGNSAPSNMLREHMVRNVCDHSSPINVYYDTATTGENSAALPLLAHTSHWAVQCTAAASAGAGLATKTVAVYKSDVGGSGNGSTPVADGTTTVPFLDAGAGCTDTGIDKTIQNSGGTTMHLYSCGNVTQNQVPDGGGSDIEPTKFVGTLAPSAGNFIDHGNLHVQSGPGLIFGPAITLALRNELQDDQVTAGLLPASCNNGGLTDPDRESEACMPSLPRTYLRTLTEGKQQLWATNAIYGKFLSVPATFAGADGDLGTADDVTPAGGNATLKGYVHLCRRVQGSGTHAEWMVHYHRTNCMSGSYAMPGQPGLAGGKPAVFEGSSSGNLGLCLDHLDKGDGYAGVTPAMGAGRASYGIGYQGLEKNVDNAENWRFVKVDGFAPTLKNVFDGNYDQVYFSSFQNRNDGSYKTGPLRSAVDATEIAAIDAFFNNDLAIDGTIAADINSGLVFSWGESGYVIPSASAPSTFSSSNPEIPWARETGGSPDSCQPLTHK